MDAAQAPDSDRGPWRAIADAALAGVVVGLLVLGVVGRGLMRLLAFTTPEDPRFTWIGTFEILGLGASWGALTGPLILPLRRRSLPAWTVGPTFGLIVFVAAAIPFALYSGFGGTLVAPDLLLWLGGLAFPILFLLHGIAVDRVISRREAGGVRRGAGKESP